MMHIARDATNDVGTGLEGRRMPHGNSELEQAFLRGHHYSPVAVLAPSGIGLDSVPIRGVKVPVQERTVK